MSSSIALKQPLSSQEIEAYKKIFQELDNEGLSIITGDKLKSLFIKSKVPNDKLAVIWELADFDNKGFLTFDQFAICCRLIGYIQFNNNTLPRNLTVEDYQTFYKLADFSGNFQPQQLNRQASFTINRQASNASLQAASLSNQILPPTVKEINQFSQLFDTYSNGGASISGESARTIFQKSKLPTQALVEIWGLTDQSDVGYLNKSQFIVAMYLVQLLMNNKIGLPLPGSLPTNVWAAANQSPISAQTPVRQMSNQNTGNFQPPMRTHSPLQRNLTNNSLNVPIENWILTPEKCQAFDAIFESLDRSRSGSLGTDVLVPYFMESGLSQDILAVIWDLADIHNNAEFSAVEFSIAMFLIQKTNAGVELPDIAPQGLLNSSIEYHQKKNISNNVNRESKPAFENKSSPLNDLLSLENSGFSPKEPQQSVMVGDNLTDNSFSQPSPLQNSLSNDFTPGKKFKPSSTFGQSIISEEPPQMVQPPSISSPRAVLSNAGSSSPLRYNYVSNLPTVPNFATLSSPSTSRQVSTAGNDSSMALSNATTEVANLSTQVRSLSNQTKIVQDRKARAEQELAKITATKVTIENRLASLRQAFNTESALAEQAENQSLELQKETEALEQELQVLENNYSSLKTQHETTNNSLNTLAQRNLELKQNISEVNAQSGSLTQELEQKKQQIQTHEGLVSVNGKQLEIAEINSSNLQNEISLIAQHFDIFHSKKRELDDYNESLVQQHQLMNDKHKELEDGFQALQVRQEDLQSKTVEVEKQEQIYNENVQRLQELFNDFQSQQERLETERRILEENELKLEQDRNDYLNKVQDFATEDFDIQDGYKLSDTSKKDILDTTASSEKPVIQESTHVNSDLLHAPEASEELLIHETTTMDDVPIHISTTSSVVNNPSQSFVDPKSINVDEDFDEPVDKGIPGGFEEKVNTNKSITDLQSENIVFQKINEIPNTPPLTTKDYLDKQIREENASFNSSIESSPKLDEALEDKKLSTELVGLPISGPPEEFPPIKELEIAESDSSDDDDEIPVDEQNHSSLNGSSPVVINDLDEFDNLEIAENEDDEFSGLEAAQVVEDEDGDDEDDEDSYHDTNEGTAFTTSEAVKSSNPEWDELFGSLEKTTNQHIAPVEVSTQQHLSSIAISPKDLAIEELTDMGFSEHDSKEALEKFNWHLESAAQFLANKN